MCVYVEKWHCHWHSALRVLCFCVLTLSHYGYHSNNMTYALALLLFMYKWTGNNLWICNITGWDVSKHVKITSTGQKSKSDHWLVLPLYIKGIKITAQLGRGYIRPDLRITGHWFNSKHEEDSTYYTTTIRQVSKQVLWCCKWLAVYNIMLIWRERKLKPQVNTPSNRFKLKPYSFIQWIGKLQHIAVAFSAPLAFNSAALPLVRCYSFDVPGGYLVELTIGICTQGRT